MILISTVRSNPDLLSYDAKFTLGFVSNPRRFNGEILMLSQARHLELITLIFFIVAITRAQAMVIVVGDPQVLSIDPMWRGFLNYLYENGGWRGDVPTWDTTAPVRTTGNYAADMRQAAASDMDSLIGKLGVDDVDIEGQANVDLALSSAE